MGFRNRMPVLVRQPASSKATFSDAAASARGYFSRPAHMQQYSAAAPTRIVLIEIWLHRTMDIITKFHQGASFLAKWSYSCAFWGSQSAHQLLLMTLAHLGPQTSDLQPGPPSLQHLP